MSERHDDTPPDDLAVWDAFPRCEGDTLHCPVCDFDYTHLVSCTVDQLGDVATVTSTGVRQATRTSRSRGSVITAQMYCEGGHQFTVSLSFSKGQIQVRTTQLPDCPRDGDEGHGYMPPEELRRD